MVVRLRASLSLQVCLHRHEIWISPVLQVSQCHRLLTLTSRFTGAARALDLPLVVTDVGTGADAGPSIPAGFALAFGVALGSTSFPDLFLSLRLGLPVVSVVTAPAAGGGGGGGPVLLLV